MVPYITSQIPCSKHSTWPIARESQIPLCKQRSIQFATQQAGGYLTLAAFTSSHIFYPFINALLTHPYNGKQTDQGDERQQPQNRCGGNHFISVHKFSPFYSSPCLRRTANWMMEITIKIRISTTPIAEAYPMLNTLKPDSYIYWNREELEVPGPGRM